MRKASLGEQELQILRFVSERAPVSVRDVATHFADARSLARTTVLTVMERLRKKGFLDRTKSEGAYVYSPRKAQTTLLRELVGDFTERILGGSYDPFIAYLSHDAKLTGEQIAELRKLVERLTEKERTENE